jgi:TrmH family RNA methyltransferase
VVLVEPKYGGNVGSVARVMMNFDIERLYLVNPCELNDECYSRAMHASSIIDNACVFSSFEEACQDLDFLVATSSIDTKSDKKHLRNPIFLPDFSKQIFNIDGDVGLLFGREDYGLLNDEIATCDLMVKIPTSDIYHSMNLSHAVGIVLYQLYLEHTILPVKRRKLDHVEKTHLYKAFKSLLDSIDYPAYKKEKTEVMFRRMISRSLPSKWEYHTLMGVIGTAAKNCNNNKKGKE